MFPIYFDEDTMRRAVERELRRIGWDCITTSEAGNEMLPDPLQLAWARDASRTILTSNQRDFSRLNTEWLESGRSHAGIIVLTDQQTATGLIIAALQAMAAAFAPEDLRNQILFLANWIPREDAANG